jgi:hypothetical protein
MTPKSDNYEEKIKVWEKTSKFLMLSSSKSASSALTATASARATGKARWIFHLEEHGRPLAAEIQLVRTKALILVRNEEQQVAHLQWSR